MRRTSDVHVIPPSVARARFADVVRRARSGDDVLIGARGVPEVRVTRDLGLGAWGDESIVPVPSRDYDVLLHGLAEAEAGRMLDELRRDDSGSLAYVVGSATADVFEHLLDGPDPWPAQDFILTLIINLRRRQEESEESRPARLDWILTGMALGMRQEFPEAKDRLFGQFRDDLAKLVRSISGWSPEDVLRPGDE